MNKVILMGRLTRDPNVRYTQQNSSQESMCVARYTLAVDRRGARDGQQSADFISCVAFGKNGEFAEKYLKQGTKIAATGRIQTSSYTNRDGQKVYTTEVVIEEQEFAESKDRNNIIRAASEFMSNFTKACKMELDGYKGTYIGFITTNDYEKKNVKQRYIVNLEFDGFFVDDDLSITFDGKTSASFYKVGTRDAPCVVEVYAKSTLTNYTISGLGEDDIIIESLAAGKTVVINAKTGLVTIDGANAFDKVNMWTFPVLKTGETALTFSNTKARVTIRYTPMWI